MDAVIGDDSPEAIRKLVEQLLESPQFGVHWGRHWLDVARYADSNGGDFNATFHNAWRYRDYVVQAFNDDKPYDQFIREQIAGDLLPFESDRQHADQIIATGFLMVGTKMLSERDKDKLRMDVVDEQISAVGRAFLAMTTECARCHDHKFDPIPTQDYYALAGIFRSTTTLEGESQQYVSTWTRRDLPVSDERKAEVQNYATERKKLQERIKKAGKDHDSLKEKLAELQTGGLTIDDADAELVGKWKASTFSPTYIGKGYVHDDQSGKGKKSARFAVRLPDAGRYDVQISYTASGNRARNVPVKVEHSGPASHVNLDQTRKPTIDGLFTSIGIFAFDAGQTAAITISNEGTEGYVIVDAVRLLRVDNDGNPLTTEESESDELAAVQMRLEAAADLKQELEGKLKAIEKNAPAPLPKALAVFEAKQIDDCSIRIRGQHRNLGAKVARGFLQVASNDRSTDFPDDQSGRVQLADWVASSDHPLTARVIVNRIWYHLLGEGIVSTVDNFGKLGSRPTWPDLLDQLAIEFVNDGWSIKNAIRRIVTSRVYQMSSAHVVRGSKADPENRWLWRAARKRLPAEAIRDSMLSISGQLDLSSGGSPVRGLGTLVTSNSPESKAYQSQQSTRRSIYLPIIRNELPAILTVFDFADPDVVTGRRPVTNVPAQALLLMNSPFVMDCSDRTVARLLATQETVDEGLVERAYELIFARQATPIETQRALEFLSDTSGEPQKQLAQLIHVMFASTEFRMLN